MLKHEEHKQNQELTRRIQAAGIPVVGEAKKDQAPELLLSQNFEVYESIVFDVTGGSGLIMPLKMTSRAHVFVFSDFYISLARWANVWFRPLEENDRGNRQEYNFYGRSELKFGRDETINRFIEDRHVFRRGHTIDGLLLAISSDRMPEDIVLGEVLEGSIRVYDQFEHDYSAQISLRVEHREAEILHKPNPRRIRLFERPDFKSSL